MTSLHEPKPLELIVDADYTSVQEPLENLGGNSRRLLKIA